MLKGLVWSVALHLLFLGSLFLMTEKSPREFLPITVLLAGDLPGDSGGGGQAAAPLPEKQKKRRTKGNPVGQRDRAPKSGAASAPEESFSTADAARTASAADIQTGIGKEHSIPGNSGIEKGAGTQSGQGGIGVGGNDEAGLRRGGGRIGYGAGSGSGTGPGPGKEGSASYLSANFAYIRDRILKGLTYPAQARRMGWKGRVLVSFVIGDNGHVENVRVLESSGYAILDANAVRTIRYCQPFPPPPVRAEVVIPIVYKIG